MEGESFGDIRFVLILLTGAPWGGWLLVRRSPLVGVSGVELQETFCAGASLLVENCGGRAVDRGVGVG